MVAAAAIVVAVAAAAAELGFENVLEWLVAQQDGN